MNNQELVKEQSRFLEMNGFIIPRTEGEAENVLANLNGYTLLMIGSYKNSTWQNGVVDALKKSEGIIIKPVAVFSDVNNAVVNKVFDYAPSIPRGLNGVAIFNGSELIEFIKILQLEEQSVSSKILGAILNLEM
ncbi:hypothetical protein FHS57_004079 [Runella defluvii]|uniref:Uncharacterized protein n=1 Tax=Runella defluvii TaxID=370973 RepID=A0A7W5ZND8_9BACT|nr:BrxA/BrxB family bacilliredoxin [Runella defluvii]MBB3840066.1 hypothetical protein [Runella defluvii]